MRGNTKKRILESLAKRRKTLTELSSELKLAPSTVYEHMQELEKSGLVKKVDEGRKWKYYELVRVRKQRAPEIIKTATMVMTALFLLLTAYFGYLYYQTPVEQSIMPSISEEHISAAAPKEVSLNQIQKIEYERYTELFGVLTLVGVSLLLIEYLKRREERD